MKLHTYGLLRNSFRPPEDIRPIRAVWRLRDRHVHDAARSVQHMQKALTSMNVHLANAISDISGTSGQAIIRSILAGERNPRKLAQLRDQRIRASEEEVARSLVLSARDLKIRGHLGQTGKWASPRPKEDDRKTTDSGAAQA